MEVIEGKCQQSKMKRKKEKKVPGPIKDSKATSQAATTFVNHWFCYCHCREHRSTSTKLERCDWPSKFSYTICGYFRETWWRWWCLWGGLLAGSLFLWLTKWRIGNFASKGRRREVKPIQTAWKKNLQQDSYLVVLKIQFSYFLSWHFQLPISAFWVFPSLTVGRAEQSGKGKTEGENSIGAVFFKHILPLPFVTLSWMLWKSK